MLRSLVEHMILSHHGQLEFGSPKVPQFPEALLLHYLDDLDSKMECMRALIENDRQVEGCFTSYNAALARSALKKDRYLNRRCRAAQSRAPPCRPDGGDCRSSPSRCEPGRARHGAAHPLFAPQTDSPLADKLKQALQSNGPKQES